MAKSEVLHDSPTSITVEVTRGCNLACVMCLRIPEEPLQLMPVDLFSRVLSQTATLPIRWLRFCGDGEPSLHPELPRFVKMARSAGIPIVGMVTNGTLLTTSRIELLRDAGLNFVAISVDACTEETYRRIRVGPHRLESLEANILDLLRIKQESNWDLEVQLNFVVQDNNRSEAEPFVERWGHLVDRVNLLQRTFINGRRRTVERRDVPPCYMASSKLYVAVDGNVFPCFVMHPPVEPLGHIASSSLGDLWSRRIQAAKCDPGSLWTPLCPTCTYTVRPWKGHGQRSTAAIEGGNRG